MAAPTNSGVSDTAMQEYEEMITSLFCPLLQPSLYVPSANSTFVYLRSNQSMENPSENQQHGNMVDQLTYFTESQHSGSSSHFSTELVSGGIGSVSEPLAPLPLTPPPLTPPLKEDKTELPPLTPPWTELTEDKTAPGIGNPEEDSGLGNDEVEAGTVGIGGEGIGELGEMGEGQLNSGCLEKGKSKVNNPGVDSGNKNTTGVRIAIPLEDILETKEMLLIDAAKHLKVSRSTLKRACREYGIHRWPPRKVISQSCPSKSPAVGDQERIPQLDTETLLPYDEVETVGIEGEGTGEGEMVVSQWNSECLAKGKGKVKIPGGKRGNKETTEIGIPLEDILQTKGMSLKSAAMNLNVSRSTLKRACREYNILKWPPRKKNKLVSQSCPNEYPAGADQEGISQLNSDILPSDQALAATVDTNSVCVKARYVNDLIIKFRLSRPWGIAELEQQVKKRLKLEAETYFIKYKDEVNELILIACDEDLQEYISSSRPLGTSPIEVFLELISQSYRNEYPAVVDQEGIPQLNSNILPSDQALTATVDTNRVCVKARYKNDIIKFPLSRPWGMAELEQQVKKRLNLEAETYFIKYKDEVNELILITCTEDLQDYISSSRLLGTSPIEVLLEPK